MDTVLRDVKHAFRMFRQAPGFSLAAVAALALAIAIAAVSDPARIVMFQNTFRDGTRSGSASPVEYYWWMQHGDTFQNIAAYEFTSPIGRASRFPSRSPSCRSVRISCGCAD